MKNRTSLIVLMVEVLTIVLLHTMRANGGRPENNSAKEVPPAKVEWASHLHHPVFISHFE